MSNQIDSALAERFLTIGIPPDIMFKFAEAGRLDRFLEDGWILIVIKRSDGNFGAVVANPDLPFKMPDPD